MQKILLILLIVSSIRLNAQEFIEIDSLKDKYYYTYIFQVDSQNRNSVKREDMVLEVGNTTSKFLSTNKFFRDSLIIAFKDEPTEVAAGKILPLVMGAPTHSFCNYTIIKNYPQQGTILTTSYLNKTHLKVTEHQILDWELIPNRDTIILGFSCKLATTEYGGRKYNAWFTLDLPLSEGPYKFNGLPGLIVSIGDVEHEHEFELIGIENSNKNQPIFFIKNKSIDVSPKDFVKAINLKTTLMYNRIQQGNSIQLDNDATKARALNKLKSRNNFIEKY